MTMGIANARSGQCRNSDDAIVFQASLRDASPTDLNTIDVESTATKMIDAPLRGAAVSVAAATSGNSN